MKRVIGQIFSEDNYGLFKSLESNRIVSEDRFKKLVKSFEEGEILNPIVVNKKMEIIDGQGRFEAKKSLGLPIFYVIDKNANIEDCRRMNHYNKPWSAIDFVQSYSNSGYPDYIRLNDVCKSLGRSPGIVLQLLGKKFEDIRQEDMGRQTLLELITTGNLRFSQSDVEIAMRNNRLLEEISYALGNKCKVTRSSVIRATTFMFGLKKYNHKTMIAHCSLKKVGYVDMASVSNQLTVFF